MSKLAFGTASLTCALLLAACPGELADIERYRVDAGDALAPPIDAGQVDCATLLPETINTRCASCHSASAPQANLDLVTGDFRVRYRNQPSQGSATTLLVNTAAFEQSAIYTKTGSPPPFNLLMPPNGAPLDEATRACLLEHLKQTPAAPADSGADAAPDAPSDASSD